MKDGDLNNAYSKEQTDYSSGQFVSRSRIAFQSLSKRTLTERPVLNENSEISIYIGGGLPIFDSWRQILVASANASVTTRSGVEARHSPFLRNCNNVPHRQEQSTALSLSSPLSWREQLHVVVASATEAAAAAARNSVERSSHHSGTDSNRVDRCSTIASRTDHPLTTTKSAEINASPLWLHQEHDVSAENVAIQLSTPLSNACVFATFITINDCDVTVAAKHTISPESQRLPYRAPVSSHLSPRQSARLLDGGSLHRRGESTADTVSDN